MLRLLNVMVIYVRRMNCYIGINWRTIEYFEFEHK